MHHASCIMHHASCIMYHESCIMRQVSCIIHHLPSLFCDHFLIIFLVDFRPTQNQSGINQGSIKDQSEIDLGSIWHRFRTFLDIFEIVPKSLWHHFGITVASFLNYSGIVLASFRVNFGYMFFYKIFLNNIAKCSNISMD